MTHSKTCCSVQTGLLASSILIGTGAVAIAQIQTGDTVGTSVSQIAHKLETSGYDIREIEVKNNRIEVDVLLDGTKLEIKVDPRSGEVIRVEID
ncbi:putative membrane protein YkoI [Labrenzia sp. EL_13]|nr:putative membrane protein YkoI [Labrenzia sp. EL_162]MBG6197033.1 putative membrane protein YkoI [Labrenzia sp. EL_159]MBG6205315.1 putative membrane protein YkoI [Labrenzia sp. EL_13]